MRIALVSPYHLDLPSGNATAIVRLKNQYEKLGHSIQTFVAERGDSAEKVMGKSPGPFDVIHGWHAGIGGRVAVEYGQQAGCPSVVTVTGTDVNQDLLDDTLRSEIQRVLAQADGVVALHAEQRALVREASGMGLAACEVILQSIAMGQAPYRFRLLNGLTEDQFVVLLPGGLRRVKAQHLALEAQRLRAVDEPTWELALAGPILEDEYAAELLDRMEHFPHARWCGPIQTDSMAAAYAEVDVVLNTSDSEGASNAILEAQFAGVPVVARDIPGNRALIEHGVDGLLFETSSELARLLCSLQRNRGLAEELSAGGKRRVAPYPSPRQEAQAHLDLYQRLIG